MSACVAFEDDDITAPFHMECVLTLKEVEAVVEMHAKTSIVYFDPYAPSDAPWLWLEHKDRVVKVFKQMTAFELNRFLLGSPKPEVR